MKCPRCQVELSQKEYEHLSVSACADCGGIWLKAGDLQPILKAHDQKFPQPIVEKALKEAHAGISPAEAEARVPCPQCSAKMNALNYDYSSGVVIHVCGAGHGLWFDKDQLEEVQVFTEHWEELERENKGQWADLAKKAGAEESARIDAIEMEERKKIGPIGGIMDSVFQRFERLTGLK